MLTRPPDRRTEPVTRIDPELPGDLVERRSSTSVAHHRSARGHAFYPAQAGEVRAQHLGHAVGEYSWAPSPDRFSSGSTASESMRGVTPSHREGTHLG